MSRLIAAVAAALMAVFALPVIVLAADTTIVITDRVSPADLTVAAGTTVTFQNDDGERHRMRTTSAPQEFDTGDIDPGGRASIVLNTPGTYQYEDHRNEDNAAYTGTITVSSNSTGTDGSDGSGGATPPPADGGGTDGSTPPPSGDSGTSPPSTASVSVLDRSFSPGQVTIAVGGTVTWTNVSDRDHTVTGSGFDSGLLPGGGRYSRTFPAAGTFAYICDLHPEMRATVVVGSGGTSTTPARSTSTGDSGSSRSGDGVTSSSPSGAQRSTSSSGTASVSSGSASAATTGAGAAEAIEPVTHTVEMVDFVFEPGRVKAHVGDTVLFANRDRAPHTATANDGSFDTGMMRTDDEASVALDKVGEFAYRCDFHPEMTGTIVVTERPVLAAVEGGAGSRDDADDPGERARGQADDGAVLASARPAGSRSGAGGDGGIDGILAGILGGAFILGATGALLYGSSRMLKAEI